MMQVLRSDDGYQVVRLTSGLQVRVYHLLVCVVMALLTLVIGVVSVSVGSTATSFHDLWLFATGQLGDSDRVYAIWDVRLSRIVLGFMAGWCVALTGAMLQSLAQNPLADPGLLGLSQGAMVMILVWMVFFPMHSRTWLPFAAFGGSLGVALLLLVLVGRQHANGLAIVLMGIAVETTLSSVTAILLLYTPAETSVALSTWMAGSLFYSSWDAIAGFVPWFIASLVALLLTGHVLRTYDLGDHMAMALGENIRRSRPLVLLVTVMLTAAALTAVGPLMFLGIMAPHLMNFIAPSTGRIRLVLSGMMGGLLVVCADTLTRTIAGDIALPVGLSLMMIGIPVFIITLRLRHLRRVRAY